MGRKDRELTDPADFISVLEKADVCHNSFCNPLRF
jgi:hypothetical protein